MAYLPSWRERWRNPRLGLQGFEAVCMRLPAACPLCGEGACGGCLCAACRADVIASRLGAAHCERCGLARLGSRPCPDCAALAPACDKVVAAFDYAFPGDVLLRQFKQQRRFQQGRALADLLARALQPGLPAWWAQAWLVPIPASRQALRRRGFNPAAELARRLSARLGGRVRTDILLRRHDAAGLLRAQKQLPRRQRLLAPGQAFACRQPLADARIVLVDDVMTTGATLHGAAHALRHAGAVSVWGAVAARTPYHVR